MASADTLAFSVEQAAAALGISRRTAFRHIATGVLRTTKLGRRRLVPASEIERLLGSKLPADSGFTSREAFETTACQPMAPPERPYAPPEHPARPALSELLAKVLEPSVRR